LPGISYTVAAKFAAQLPGHFYKLARRFQRIYCILAACLLGLCRLFVEDLSRVYWIFTAHIAEYLPRVCSLVTVSFQHVYRKLATNLLRICCKFAASLQPIYSEFATYLLRVCCKFTANLLQHCRLFVANLPFLGWKMAL
jgi:hypothetical protein